MPGEGADDRLADLGPESREAGLRIAPGCYTTGDGIAADLHDYLGTEDDLSNVLIAGGETALDVARGEVERSLDTLGVEYEAVTLEGECTPDRVSEYREVVEEVDPDVLVGLGGGKALDTAKLIAEGNCPVALLPTVASTCAAWTPLSVVYDEDGSHLGAVRLSRCPEWVLVDTGIIARAPSRLLAAGVMDATAKHFETAYIPEGEMRKPAQWGTGVAQESYRACLRDDAVEAIAACERGELTETVEDVIDACIAGPGLTAGLLGGQSHLLLGHVFCYRLREDDAVRERSYHGERVAYGVLLFQLLMGEGEGRVAELKEWYESFGPELSLESLGLTAVDERVVSDLARAIDDGADYDLVEREISYEGVQDAIRTIEAM
ncbi:iron-containing alcohol dehydrogenase [Salinirubellus sp. GCM10025818]|uniref:iron-containing alcohol dehydrogenase n=1 Tax=Salinirubellus TaxID=2162630 RepID=UPI0030D60290